MNLVDKEGMYVVMLSANLEFTVWDKDSVLALARVTLEDESFFVCVERVLDLLVFAKERVLGKYFEVALTPSGFLGFVLDEVGFIQGVIILDVLFILLFNLSFFNFLLFLALLCYLLPPFFEVFIPG